MPQFYCCSLYIFLMYPLSHRFSPLPKSSQPTCIRSNTDLYDFETSPKNMAKLDALDWEKAGIVSWNPVDGCE
ncbi:hypothetical protein BKA93DRAFT_732571 [Sparassis latifolia]